VPGGVLRTAPLEVMNVQCSPSVCRTSQTTAHPREIEAQALLKAARQLQDVATNWTGPDKNMHQALLFQSPAVVDLHERGGNQRQSAAAGNSSEHRQYRVFVMKQTVDMQIIRIRRS